MPGAIYGEGLIDLKPQLSKGFGKDVEKGLGKLGKDMGAAGKTLTRRVTLPLLGAAAGTLKLLEGQEKAEAQLQSVLKSTGGAANVTAGHVKDLASSLQEVTTFGDETTISAANLLLTFKDIRNEVGEGNDIFDQTVRITQDVATAMGMDLNSAALQVGKALNDPATGLSMLTRVGITFTEEQKNMISTLQESGDTMGAQKIILQELESQFGGSAEAMAGTTSGKLKQALNDLGDAGEEIGAIIAPIAVDMAETVKDLVQQFQDLSPETKEMIVRFGGMAAVAGPLLIILGQLVTAVGRLGSGMKSTAKFIRGPWAGAMGLATGLAIGVAAVIKQNVDRTNFWKEALAGSASQLNSMTDEMLVAEIVNRDLGDSMAEAGIDAQDLKDAILGDEEAAKAFFDRLSVGQKDVHDFVQAQRNARGAAEDHQAALEDTEDQLDSTKGAIQGIIAGGLQPYMTATENAAGAQGGLEDETRGATSAIRDQFNALREQVDPLFRLREASQRAAEAQEAMTGAAEEFGEGSPEHVDAISDAAEANLDLEDAELKAKEASELTRAEFVKQQIELGLTGDEARLLADEFETLNAFEFDPKTIRISTVTSTAPIVTGSTRGQGDGFDLGGTVPGPKGVGRLVFAHGGETILPTHEMSPAEAFASQFSASELHRSVGKLATSSSGGGQGVTIEHLEVNNPIGEPTEESLASPALAVSVAGYLR